jgi:selenocysteine lyase/cysteine desulfurase
MGRCFALPPGKFETGTQNHECMAGTRAAVEYLAQIAGLSPTTTTRRERIVAGMSAIKAYEQTLSAHLIAGLQRVPKLHIWGITDPQRMAWRVPTVSFTMNRLHPRQIAEYLGQRGIFVWDGNYYALAIMEKLGLQQSGGMVRVGLVHYNTLAEIDRLAGALLDLTGRS